MARRNIPTTFRRHSVKKCNCCRTDELPTTFRLTVESSAVPKRKGGRLVGLARRASSYPASSSQAPYADPMILEELHDKDERIGALEEQNTTILSENATIRSENATILAELASQKKFNTEIMQKLDRERSGYIQQELVLHVLCIQVLFQTVHEIDKDPDCREIEKALMRLGCSTPVPAIFVRGKLMGSTTEAMSMHLSGSLVPLVKPFQANLC
ncbi:hypothetical protein F2Q69_00016977 [Brassica cretica]|uniref:Glutaredoxin domain-containing protein n=1 Tax=Brassica cretica TaxID=69181 RepID=A0A8S9R1M3_BRACR|nr:hypothetical protein F2Q69_00016977 [Brassica cretica]